MCTLFWQTIYPHVYNLAVKHKTTYPHVHKLAVKHKQHEMSKANCNAETKTVTKHYSQRGTVSVQFLCTHNSVHVSQPQIINVCYSLSACAVSVMRLFL